LKRKIGKYVRHKISEELRISFSYNGLKYTDQFLFIIQRDALLMYHKFDYKLKKLTLITFTRWLP